MSKNSYQCVDIFIVKIMSILCTSGVDLELMSNGCSNEVILHWVYVYMHVFGVIYTYTQCNITSFERPFDTSSRSTPDVHKLT
jgi:hypothetical protein